MLDNGIECESLTVVSIDSLVALVVLENTYYLQVYLDNCASKITDKWMIDYHDENLLKLLNSRSCKYSIRIE